MYKFKFLISVLIFFNASITFAVTLEEALISGYQNHEDLKIIRTDYLDEIERFPRALANFMPKIFAEFSATDSLVSRKGSSIDANLADAITTDNSRYTKAITLEQQVFNGGSSVAEMKAAQSAFRASKNSYYAKEQDVIFREIGTYVDCVEAREKYMISKISVKSNKAQLEAMKERFRLGESTETEVATASTGLANAQATQSQNEANFEATKAEFTKVFALDPVNISMPSEAFGMPKTLDEFIEKAIAANPSLIAAHHTTKAAKASEYALKGALLPKVAVTIRKGTNEYLPENRFNSNINNESTTATLSVNVPILSRGGAEYSDIRRGKHQTRKAIIQFNGQMKQIKSQCKAAWEAYDAAKNSLAATFQGVSSASIAYEGILQEEMLGSKTIIDVLTFEERLNNARYSKVEAQKQLLLASYRIKSLMGDLTAHRMKLPVQCFDPDKEFRNIKLKIVGF